MATSAQNSKRISITREMEEAPVHACDYCGVMTVYQCSATHSNSLKIGGCPLFSFYCCVGHQLLDGVKHLEKCEKEAVKNQLIEIGRTVQDCWLTIRQNTWDNDVKTIRIDDLGAKGNVVCELGDGVKFADGKVFHDFDVDEALLENLETKFGNVRDAVLTAGTSEHAVACLYKLVEYLLGDLTTKAHEIRVSPSVPLLVVQGLTNPDTPENKAVKELNHAPNHWVYKLTTKNGEEYALDITGIQYGDDCVCFRWQDVALDLRVFGGSHFRLHNALNTEFTTLEEAYREISWMLLSSSLDAFIVKVKEMEVETPLGRQELVQHLDQFLKKNLPIDASALFKEWTSRHCDTPTPLNKFLGTVAPGVVPKVDTFDDEVEIGSEEAKEEVEEVEELETENMFERYQRIGRVKCPIL